MHDLSLSLSLVSLGTAEELERYHKGFDKLTTRSSNQRSSQYVAKSTFIKEVLGANFPTKIAERIFQCLDNTSSGALVFRDFLIGMVILVKGTHAEKSACMCCTEPSRSWPRSSGIYSYDPPHAYIACISCTPNKCVDDEWITECIIQ